MSATVRLLLGKSSLGENGKTLQAARWLFAAAAVFIFAADSISKGNRPQAVQEAQGKSKENEMVIYPRIFADYQKSSRQTQTTKAAGAQQWFLPSTDKENRLPPSLIILFEQGLAVEYINRFAMISYDGRQEWERERDAGLDIFTQDGAIFYRNSARRLAGVDSRNKVILDNLHVTTSKARGFFYLVMPLDKDRYVVQTFNRPEEKMPGEPYENDTYNLVLMEPAKRVWLQEFEGVALPALVTNDLQKVVIPDEQGKVIVCSIDGGAKVGGFELESCEFHGASLDPNDNIILAMYDKDRESRLCSYKLSGVKNWEYAISSINESAYAQPPAVDSRGRVYYIVADQVFAIENGNLVWSYALPSADRQCVTLLGDDGMLITALNEITHLGSDGNKLGVIRLKAGETITTPAVVGTDGRIYIGTASGIYCFN